MILILLVNWNGRENILACLRSLEAVQGPSFDIAVVDNGSRDGSAQAITRSFPDVTVIQSIVNLGFTGGNNLGLMYAQRQGYEYVLLLNNDTEVAPDFLAPLVQAMEDDPQAAAAGPLIYYHARPRVVWSAGGVIDWQRGETRMLGLDEHDSGQFDSPPQVVDFVTGCALLVRLSVVAEVGALDERFFAYYEEVEWCVRMQRAGYRILFVPQSKVWHKISPDARQESPQVHYYMTRNRLLFLHLAHAPLRARLWTVFSYARTLLSWSLKPRWRHKAPQRRAMLQAIWDYGHGRLGMRNAE
ncbi:MAG: glycosyltransferase family 2 protein [Anaerolineales bacterium]